MASDQDVYMFESANKSLAVYKSDNFGSSFSEVYGVMDPEGTHGRDLDVCFDKNDPEIIHWVTHYRNWSYDDRRFVYRRSVDGGTSWTVLLGNIAGNKVPYSNAAVCTDSFSNVYIVYTDESYGNAEVYGKFSTNKGSTFGPRIKVSNHTGQDGHVEIITTTDGNDVVIGWLEDRDGIPRVVSRKG